MLSEASREKEASGVDANHGVVKNPTPENVVVIVFEFERRLCDLYRLKPKGVPLGKLEVHLAFAQKSDLTSQR